MNATTDLGSGLELVTIDSIDFDNDSSLMQLVRQGVALQRKVFSEQKVTHPNERVLLYEDSVGTKDDVGSLCEGQPYHHLYLLKGGKLIGMRATQEFDDIPGIKGTVAIDYFPALVLLEEHGRKYYIRLSDIGEKGNVFENMTLVDLLMRFSKHLKSPEAVVARFNDGLGLNMDVLRRLGYQASELKVPVPSMAASTIKEYDTLIDELTIFGRFDGLPALLSQDSAERILVEEYLIAGYVNVSCADEDGVRQILDRRGRQLKTKVEELECVKLLRQRISEAVADHAYVLFLPF